MVVRKRPALSTESGLYACHDHSFLNRLRFWSLDTKVGRTGRSSSVHYKKPDLPDHRSPAMMDASVGAFKSPSFDDLRSKRSREWIQKSLSPARSWTPGW